MAISDNIKIIRKYYDLSQKDLAIIAGVTDKAVSTWEQGLKEPRMGTIQKIADHFGIQKSNIIEDGGLDDIVNRHDLSKSNNTLHSSFTQSTPYIGPSTVPILGKIRCGIPLLDESNWEDRIEVPNGIKADFAARAEGDSMIYAGIHEGDIILFRENSEPYNGQVVATRHISETEGVNLKYFIKKNDRAYLRSANPEYEDMELNGTHKIIGVMSGLIREEAPSIHEYESMLSVKTDTEDRWTETIALASAHGITPEAIQNMINMHVNMAFSLSKKKK